MDSDDVTVRPGDSGTELGPGVGDLPEVEQDGPDSPDGSAPPDLTPDVRSVSVARQIDGARAWESSDRLARLALLLTGSPEQAYRLTRRTLISVGRTGPYVQARRRLVRRAVRARVNGYAAGLLPGLDGPTPAARLWRRLMGLPTADRALLVLTEAEGMADPVAGAVLGLPRAETEQTLARLRGVVEAQAQLTEAERREVLAGPALRSASGVVPVQALSRALRTRRVRRAVVALAAVLVVGGASVAVATADPGGHPGTDPVLLSGDSPKLADPGQWQARGDLLTDHGLLRAAVRVWLAAGYRGQAPGHPDRPAAVWAGRLTGGRSLVVLAGQDPAGRRVLGALLDRGHGPALVRTVPSVPALAVNLGALAPDPPGSHRYLVAPWVAAMAVNDVDGRQPTGAQRFLTVGLHDGLSEPWDRRTGSDHCTRPLLQLAQSDTVDGADTSVTDDTIGYALDVAGPGPTATVTAPPRPGTARDAYFTALHGLLACVGPGGFHRSLVGSTSAARGIVTDLSVAAVWSGRLPDGGTGQALRWTWRVVRPPADAGSEPAPDGDAGQVFALVTGDVASFSTVRFAAGPADTAVDGVVWFSARNRHGYLLLAGGPAVARVDLAPRPKGFRPGHPVAFLGLPGHGHRLSVVGLDSTGRPISVQPLDF